MIFGASKKLEIAFTGAENSVYRALTIRKRTNKIEKGELLGIECVFAPTCTNSTLCVFTPWLSEYNHKVNYTKRLV